MQKILERKKLAFVKILKVIENKKKTREVWFIANILKTIKTKGARIQNQSFYKALNNKKTKQQINLKNQIFPPLHLCF